jgi:hypothetical protein
MAAVIGIIGYTHGVNDVSTPAPKISGSTASGLCESCEEAKSICMARLFNTST